MHSKCPYKGQGLIETLLILLFVSFSVIALIRYQHNLAYRTSNTQQQTDAILLAQRQLETLRNFQVLTTTSGYTAYQNIASGSSNSTVGNTTYTLTWTVTTNTNPDYKTLDVTVSWTNNVGAAQSVRLVTRVAGVDPAASAAIM